MNRPKLSPDNQKKVDEYNARIDRAVLALCLIIQQRSDAKAAQERREDNRRLTVTIAVCVLSLAALTAAGIFIAS